MKGRLLAAVLLGLATMAGAQKQTVCTVTVNSPDEREVFRRFLPEDRFEFVELVQHGRPDFPVDEPRTLQRVVLGDYTPGELVPNLEQLLADRPGGHA